MDTDAPSAADTRADRLWRRWTGVAVAVVLIASATMGFVIMPVVQGQKIGLDPWTAICRSLGILPGTPAVTQPPSTGRARPVSKVSWTPDILDRLNGANRANGASIAGQVCSSCHGEEGVSPSADFPHLAGQSAAAIYKQLNDYRTGARVHPQMTPVAQALSDRDLADIAAYYAGDNAFGSLGRRTPVSEPAIDLLATVGDPARGLPACNACHGSGSGGPIETPTLSGQHQAYLEAQLDLYATGRRGNDVYARMRTIAARLTEEEKQGLAEYYEGFR